VSSATNAAMIAATAALATAGLSFRSSTRANRSGDRRVGLEEHRDAMARLQTIIDQQDKHQDRIRQQMERVQDQLAKEQDVSAALRNQIMLLQIQLDELMRSRARLENMLNAVRGIQPEIEG
jgi:septal ring factor EnvC (AmiA/AmiB activator)